MVSTNWQLIREVMNGVIDACEAGMSKFVIPIFFKGEYQGALTGCGTCVHREEIETFVIEKSSKMKEEEIGRLAQDVNEVEQAKVDDMAKRLFKEIKSDEQRAELR